MERSGGLRRHKLVCGNININNNEISTRIAIFANPPAIFAIFANFANFAKIAERFAGAGNLIFEASATTSGDGADTILYISIGTLFAPERLSLFRSDRPPRPLEFGHFRDFQNLRHTRISREFREFRGKSRRMGDVCTTFGFLLMWNSLLETAI